MAENTDPDLRGHYAGWLISAVNEKLALGNWAAPRDQMSLTGWYVPTSGFVGGLAESWEQPDDVTTILNIRQGVHWHDKPPLNGREFTADDVVYTLRRRAGLTDFVPERTYEMIGLPWESIEATDQYTVVLKLTEPRLGALRVYLAEVIQWILPPEVIEQNGDYSNWRNVVGTGPYMLTDYVEGTSITRTRNPNYWGHDEKYPDNQLPYADELRGLFMEEEATRIAAMRTGQVDIIHTSGGGVEIKTVEQVDALLRTNPDLQVGPYFIRALQVFGVNQRRPPFDDIRVRQALQMSIDREAINDSYYGGYALWKPQGHFGNAVAGYHVPFDEWPEEVQATYRYNPEEAMRLLDEAGYPAGADGFRLRVAYDHRDVIDLGFAEIVSGYWKEIGIEVEINIMDTTTWVSRRKDKSYEMTTGGLGLGSRSRAAHGILPRDRRGRSGAQTGGRVPGRAWRPDHDAALPRVQQRHERGRADTDRARVRRALHRRPLSDLRRQGARIPGGPAVAQGLERRDVPAGHGQSRDFRPAMARPGPEGGNGILTRSELVYERTHGVAGRGICHPFVVCIHGMQRGCGVAARR